MQLKDIGRLILRESLATDKSFLRHDGEILLKLIEVNPRQTVSFVASIIGLVWSFVTMFVLSWVVISCASEFPGPA